MKDEAPSATQLEAPATPVWSYQRGWTLTSSTGGSSSIVPPLQDKKPSPTHLAIPFENFQTSEEAEPSLVQ